MQALEPVLFGGTGTESTGRGGGPPIGAFTGGRPERFLRPLRRQSVPPSRWLPPLVALFLVQEGTVITYRVLPGEASAAVAQAPTLDLGASGAPAELFSRIATVRRQRSGHIVVANRAPAELRVFDRDGRYVRTIGREGQGPGEFQDISDVVVRRGDSLVVLDRRQRRFTFLRPDGGYVSSFNFDPPFSTSLYNASIGALDDGTVLVGYSEVATNTPSPQPVLVYQHVGRYSTAGVRFDSAGKYFVGENFLQAAPRSMGGFAFWDRTWGRTGEVVATGNTFIAGDASAMEVRRHSTTGALLETHRVPIPRKAVSAADIAAYKRAALARVSGDPAVAQRRVEEMPYPQEYPAYERFLVDARGRIWIKEFLTAPGPNRWLILDPRTREAQPVLLPARFVPTEIGATDVIGVWRDADDVEHVRAYRLLR